MNKTLIIVDPQYDFIEGGKLAVEGGHAALDNIVDYLDESEDLSTIIITQDWHNGSHCSFKDYGGQWPEHCVQGTHGAAIYKPILDVIKKKNLHVYYIQKGKVLEEYTAFLGRIATWPNWISYKTSNDNYMNFHKDEVVEICGLAGDICVMNTAIALKAVNPVIIEEMTACIDSNNFRWLADQNDIKIV